VIEDGDDIVAETGAIIVYILDKYGKGKLRPERDAPEYLDYVHFLHFAEGSAMLPLLLALYTGFLGEAAAPIQPMIMKEIKGVLDYCEYRLVRSEYFAGDMMTGADITMIFPLEAAKARGAMKPVMNLLTKSINGQRICVHSKKAAITLMDLNRD